LLLLLFAESCVLLFCFCLHLRAQTPERKDLQTPNQKKREREGEKTRERETPPTASQWLFVAADKNRERETTPAQKKNTERVLEMASFAEAPAGDVAKGTSSPSFFLSLFSRVCVCV